MNEMEIRNKFLKGNRFKINIAWLITIALVVCTIIFSFIFGGNSGDMFQTSTERWVHDNDGLLSDATLSEILAKNNRLLLEVNNKPEIVVAIEKDSSKNKNLPKRAEDLFKEYKVSDYGMLFIVAVPDNSQSGIGAAINEFIDDLLGTPRYSYSYCLGRNVDYLLGDRIELEYEDAFFDYYKAGNYNDAVLSMFNNLYNDFGGQHGLSANAGSAAAEPHSEGFLGAVHESRASGMVSIIAIIILALFMIFIFSRRRRPYVPHRVYRSPRWFGFGLGMGMGMGRRYRRPPMGGGFGGSFFNSSPGNRTGGGSRSSGFGNSGRTGGGFRGGSGSGRSGGGFRGGSGSGRSGGGFRGGGGSRGGGGRRR
jgi:uncharacterized membrane protein YgcG